MPLTTSLTIRRLTQADGASFRALRLEALTTSPFAFARILDEEQTRSIDDFISILNNNLIMGAFQDDRLIGMLGFHTADLFKERHLGYLWGLYINPAFRGYGGGDALMAAMIKEVPPPIEILKLAVLTTSTPIVRLYEKYGFEIYGTDRAALKDDTHYYDLFLMARDLRSPQE